MEKDDEKRSGGERREKSNKRVEAIIDCFIPKKEEKRSGQDRRKPKKPVAEK